MKSPRLPAKVQAGPVVLAVLAALAALTGCELFTGRTGGGTETESAVVLHNVDGSPAAGARVRLRPADYLADSLLVTEEVETRMEATTDARGAFRFRDLPAGAWRLEADGGNGRGLVADFRIDDGDAGIRLADDTLRPHGSISGTFAERDPEHVRYVQIQGMERLVIADPATGSFLVNGLPPGRYHLRFLALQPFRGQAARREVAVASGEVASLDPVALQGETRLAFRVDSGALVVDGVGERNPVLFDNEYWSAEPDNEFAWALASAGRLDLRGNIVTDAFRAAPSVDGQLGVAKAELRLARLAGMSGIPDPVAGSRRRLRPSASGRPRDIEPEASPGRDLILAEARKATPERPLVVVAGGPLTTVASALLTDSTIADRLVVAAVYSFSYNAVDSLATYVVAKRGRLIHWGRGYAWDGRLDTADLARIPRSRRGEQVRGHIVAFGKGGKLALNDVAPLAYLVHQKVWTAADMARLALPLTVRPASALSFNFLDIPAAANDWNAIREVFFGALSDTAAYRPAVLPGTLEAEGYSDHAVASLLQSTQGSESQREDAMGGFVSGAWVDFSCHADTARVYRATLRYRSVTGGSLLIGESGGVPVRVDLPASHAWAEARTNLSIGAGRRILRVSHRAGAFDLDRIEFE